MTRAHEPDRRGSARLLDLAETLVDHFSALPASTVLAAMQQCVTELGDGTDDETLAAVAACVHARLGSADGRRSG
jgi:hypothetical protein